MNIYVVSPKHFVIIGTCPLKSYVGSYIKAVFIAPDIDHIISYMRAEQKIDNEKWGDHLKQFGGTLDINKDPPIQRWGYYQFDYNAKGSEKVRDWSIDIIGVANKGVKPGFVTGRVVTINDLKDRHFFRRLMGVDIQKFEEMEWFPGDAPRDGEK